MAVQRSAQSFLRADLSPFFSSTSHHASLSRSRQSAIPCIARRPAAPSLRCPFSASSRQRQQAAARRDDEDESQQEQPRNQDDHQKPSGPSRRITLAERHTTAPPEPPQRTGPKKDNRISFLDRAVRAPTTPPRPSPQPQRPQQLGAQSPGSSASQPGQRPSPDFSKLYAGASEKLDFARGRSVRPGGNQEQYTTSKATSVEDLLSEFGLKGGRASTPSSTPYREGDKRSFDLSNMRQPNANADLLAKPDAHALAKRLDEYNRALAKAIAPPTFRVGPGLGRTVTVAAEKGMDVARAFQMVNVKCNANSVKQDMNAQRFHERPGVRRKRLASVRWRRRFKEAFRATIRRVEDMRRKGW